MKKKISKILGVALTVTLLASMLIIATPAPAAAIFELTFMSESIASSRDYILPSSALTILDMAVSGDIIYAVTGATTDSLLKSSDGGDKWEDLTNTTGFPTGTAVNLVAVAPDDSNIIVVVTTTEIPYFSTDGGASWTTLGIPATGATINDIAVSGMTGGYTYIAAGGTDGTDAELYTMKLAMAQGWVAQSGNSGFATGQSYIQTVELSPNFQIDKIIGVISANATDVVFQCFRYESGALTWNAQIAYFGSSWGTGVVIDAITPFATAPLAAADIEFLPSFDGTDDGERITFVSFADSGSAGDVLRLTDSYAKQVTTWAAAAIGPVNSLAYHEAGKLLIGDYNENQVYISLSPMASNPMCERVNSFKQPGGSNKTLVAWNGDTVAASTQGDESCFSVSEDDAYSFNDISLFNTTISVVTDIAVSANGGTIYQASYDSSGGTGTYDVSIWSKSGATDHRVLSLKNVADAAADIAIRIAPDDSNVLYLNVRGSQDMWMSRDGGRNKWKSVPCYKLAGVTDFVVESSDVLYAISTSGISKSVNGAASWSEEKGFEGKTAIMITLAPNNDILVGCNGYILVSTDGGSTFSAGAKSGNNIVVADSNYATNKLIYYSTGSSVSRCTSTFTGTTSMGIELPDGTPLASGYSVSGLVVAGNALYALTSDGTDSRLYRALEPSTATNKQTALWGYASTSYEFGQAAYLPQPLKVAPDYSKMPQLFMIDDGGSAKYFKDPLAVGGTTANTPADKEEVPVNSLTGRAYDMPFSWNRFSSAEIITCQLQISTDADFNALLVNTNVVNISTDLISVIVGPYGAVASEFMPSRTYYWRVRVSAINAGPLLSPWSATRSFTVSSEVKFAIAGPAVGATGVSINPTLSWNEYPGALHYVVELADGSIPEGITFTILDLSNTSDYPFFHIDEGLKYSNPYYWRVRAALEGGEYSEWLTGSFTTEAKPAEPQDPIIIQEPPEQPPIIIEPVIEIPPTTEVIPSYLLWIIVAIGAILLIALIVLIVRTRRVV